MFKRLFVVASFVALVASGFSRPSTVLRAAVHAADPPSWNQQAAAKYLDSRVDWWMKWPGAQRDHDTACVSCHTGAPYALARPTLRGVLHESAPSSSENAMAAGVAK